MKDILVDPIVEGEIKHSRKKIEPIRFKEDVVNKVKSSNHAFGKKRELGSNWYSSYFEPNWRWYFWINSKLNN